MRTKFDKNIARLQFQKEDMMNLHNKKLLDEQNEAIENRNKIISEESYLSFGSALHTKRMRQQSAERAMEYEEHFATVALTEALSDCAKKSLLLNTDEYAKLNENYETEITNTVKRFLENAEINEDIDNPIILNLYEEIIKELPPADLYLTEEDEKMIIRQNILSKDAIKTGLDALCRDVKARTANIVSKDQESMQFQNADLEEIDNKELEAAPLVSPEELATEEDLPLEDPDAVDPVQNPQFVGQSVDDTSAQVMHESAKPRIIKESKKQGIVETLAMNEATQMISEGKEYNSTLALANALKYITILETLDASGLVKIGKEGYNKILSASGVDMTPVRASDIPGTKAHLCDAHIQPCAAHPFEKVELPETHKESALRDKISEIVRSSMPAGLTVGTDVDREVFKPYSEWKKEHSGDTEVEVFDTPTAPVMTEEDLKGKFTNMKGEIFTESELMDFFENQGFNLNLSDFEELWRSWNFKKH